MGGANMTRPYRPLVDRALWAELRATFTTRPVCPECARFIHPALWDAHMARHHEDRVGMAEEAMNPPPIEEEPDGE